MLGSYSYHLKRAKESAPSTDKANRQWDAVTLSVDLPVKRRLRWSGSFLLVTASGGVVITNFGAARFGAIHKLHYAKIGGDHLGAIPGDIKGLEIEAL